MELTIDRRPSDFYFPIEFSPYIYKKWEGQLDEPEWEEKVPHSTSGQSYIIIPKKIINYQLNSFVSFLAPRGLCK